MLDVMLENSGLWSVNQNSLSRPQRVEPFCYLLEAISSYDFSYYKYLFPLIKNSDSYTNKLSTNIQKAFLVNIIMTNKHNPDQLAEAAVVSESPDLKQAEGDAPAAKNLPKRRISGDQSQNKQAPNRKKSKLAVPPTVVASRAHDDKNNQE